MLFAISASHLSDIMSAILFLLVCTFDLKFEYNLVSLFCSQLGSKENI